MKTSHSLIALLCLGLTHATLRAEQVIISEIMYHPAGLAPEYIEVQNLTATPFDIANWKFSNGLDYEFPDFNSGDSQAHILKAFERILIAPVDATTLRGAYAIPGATRIFARRASSDRGQAA